MIVMFRMPQAKREKMLKKLDKMEEFIEEFKYCLEDAEEEEGEYRRGYRHDDDEDDYDSSVKSRYSRMRKRGM